MQQISAGDAYDALIPTWLALWTELLRDFDVNDVARMVGLLARLLASLGHLGQSDGKSLAPSDV